MKIELPHVNQKCPYFELHEVENYKKKQVTINDFKGKWLVLDFWNEYCGSCIASFPKLNQMQKDFKDSVQFISLAYTGSQYFHMQSYYKIKKLYARVKKDLALDLVIAYDSLIFKQFNVVGCPQIAVISPDGVLKYFSAMLDEKILRSFMHGEEAKVLENGEMASIYTINYKHTNLPWMTTGEKTYDVSDTSFLFRSYFAKWHPTQPTYFEDGFLTNRNKGMINLINIGPDEMILYSMFGTGRWPLFGDSSSGEFYRKIFYNVKDTSRFVSDMRTGENRYIYSLKVPQSKASTEFMSSLMRTDIQRYLNIKLEIDTMYLPYLKVVIIDTILAKKSQEADSATYLRYEKIKADHIGYVCYKKQIKEVIGLIDRYYHFEGPLIDETGIEKGVTLFIDCPFFQYEALCKELGKYGLGIKSGNKMLKVLKISDN